MINTKYTNPIKRNSSHDKLAPDAKSKTQHNCLLKKSNSSDNIVKKNTMKRVKSLTEMNSNQTNLSNEKKIDYLKKIVISNCPGIVYDIIKNKDVIDNNNMIDIVKDHVADAIIHHISDHIISVL
jgi:hypothetical protein